MSNILSILFPSLNAWLANMDIEEKQTIKEKNVTQELNERRKKLTPGKNEIAFCKMADDLHNFEVQRLNILARKGTSILAATGFVITLMLLTLTLKKDWFSSSYFSLIGFCIILVAVYYFGTSAICASASLRVSQFHQITVLDSQVITEKKLQTQQEYNNEWALEKMSCVDTNYNILQIKTNWLDAAQESFLLGISLTIICFIILAFTF
jgi:hypothetical protein